MASSLSLFAALFLAAHCFAQDLPTVHKTKNVIVVMTDGLRWQEVYGGADPTLIDKHGPRLLGNSAKRTAHAKELYWRETPIARRQVLMPFLWSVVAEHGQLYGNKLIGSKSRVRNKMRFSYPGYNETLTGAPDDQHIHSNKEGSNPNQTVFEWLNKKASFSGKVAAFGAWEVFEDIFNAKDCGFLVNAGYEPLAHAQQTSELDLLNALKASTPRIWEDEPFDALPFYTALEYMKLNKPRLLFIGLGETDVWAHMGSYPEYLNAAHRDDEYLRQLWTFVQSTPEYRDQTTLIVLPDHGRSNGLLWRWHGSPFPGSGDTWMAFMGPDTPPLGEREMISTVTEGQIAATVAALLGEDYKSDFTKVGDPIPDVLSASAKPAAALKPPAAPSTPAITTGGEQ
jgi:hypothetical protein